jgi:hypothetical protein
MIASDYITLSTLDRIFKEKAEIEIKPLTKMLYINVLTHHFKSLEANEKNLSAFDMFPKDLQYEKFENQYQELHKAKLITIGNTFITFNNVWGSYIDRYSLNEIKKATYESSMKTAEFFKEEMLKNQSMFEVIGMKHKLTRITLLKMIDIFITEQKAIQNKYENASEVTKHFIHWSGSYASKIHTTPEVVKSKNKIIGFDERN